LRDLDGLRRALEVPVLREGNRMPMVPQFKVHALSVSNQQHWCIGRIGAAGV